MNPNKKSFFDDIGTLVNLDNLSSASSPKPSTTGFPSIAKGPHFSNSTTPNPQYQPSLSQNITLNRSSPHPNTTFTTPPPSHSHQAFLLDNSCNTQSSAPKTNLSQNNSSIAPTLNPSSSPTKKDVFGDLLNFNQHKDSPKLLQDSNTSQAALNSKPYVLNTSNVVPRNTPTVQKPADPNSLWEFDLLLGQNNPASKFQSSHLNPNSNSFTNFKHSSSMPEPSVAAVTFDPISSFVSNKLVADLENSKNNQTNTKSKNDNSGFSFSWDDNDHKPNHGSQNFQQLRSSNKVPSQDVDFKLATIIQSGYSLEQAQDALMISENNAELALQLLKEQTNLTMPETTVQKLKQHNHSHSSHNQISKKGYQNSNSSSSINVNKNNNTTNSNLQPHKDFAQKTVETTEKLFTAANQAGSNFFKQASGWFESSITSVKKSYSKNSTQSRTWAIDATKSSQYRKNDDYYKDSSSDESTDNMRLTSHTSNYPNKSEFNARPSSKAAPSSKFINSSSSSLNSDYHQHNEASSLSYDGPKNAQTKNFESSNDLAETGDLLNSLDIRSNDSHIVKLKSQSNPLQQTTDRDAFTSRTSQKPKALGSQQKVSDIAPDLFGMIVESKDSANNLFKLGQHEEASQGYSKCIKLAQQINTQGSFRTGHPYLSLLLNNRAACYLKTGELKLCLNDSLKASEIAKIFVGSLKVSVNGETIDLDAQFKKALMRASTCYENLEKYEEALASYNGLLKLNLDHNMRTQVNNGILRCEKFLNRKPTVPGYHGGPTKQPIKPHTRSNQSFRNSPSTGIIKPLPRNQLSTNLHQNTATIAPILNDNQLLELRDSIQQKVRSWASNNKSSLRALLGSIHQIYPNSAQISLADLVENKQVKIAYMKTVSKLHPDKKKPNESPEDTILKAELFTVLSDAWTIFNQQKN